MKRLEPSGEAAALVRIRLTSQAAQRPGGALGTVVTAAVLILFLFWGMAFLLVPALAHPRRPFEWFSLLWATTMLMSCGAVLQQTLRALERPLVEIGSDGVLLRKAGRAVFVAYRDIDDVVFDERGVRLKKRDQTSYALCTCVHVESEESEATERQRELYRAIWTRIASGRRSDGLSAAKLELLDRQGRSVASWREHLSTLTRGAAGYRDVSFGFEELLTVVEDGSLEPERRVGAALALATQREREKGCSVEERVRVVAGASANPGLRVAITKASRGELDEAALETAMGAESRR
jgi:hypothetical protein